MRDIDIMTPENRLPVKVEFKNARQGSMVFLYKRKNRDEKHLTQRLINIYYKNILISTFILGFLFGIFILAPFGLVIEHYIHAQEHTLSTDLEILYSFQNIPWLLLFATIGGIFGLLYGFLHKRFMNLREQLHHKEKLAAIGELSAGVAHEINTPLTNIALLAENIEAVIEDEDISARIQEIEGQVQAASTIVSGLMEFSKRSSPDMSEVDINDLIVHTVDFVKGWKRTDVRITLDLAEHLPLAKGDHLQLQQVFLNIIKNAHDAMPDGGALGISSNRLGDDHVQISFKDEGVGIPKDTMSKLFNPFYTTKENGLGLGLSICYGIIEAHEGWIDVESMNGGTVFKVVLQRWN